MQEGSRGVTQNVSAASGRTVYMHEVVTEVTQQIPIKSVPDICVWAKPQNNFILDPGRKDKYAFHFNRTKNEVWGVKTDARAP